MSPYTGVALGGGGWLESRDDDTTLMQQNSFNQTRNGNISQAANNRTAAQQMFFDELRFSPVRSIRTSIIILASFNIIAAFATALGILCDGYFRKKRNDRNFTFWRNGFSFVSDADVYPLVLSVGIFIQSFIFAGAQSTGLDSFFGRGCTWLAQLMLPAVFLAPYIQLVFGVEVATRALQKKPFQHRRKYSVSICLSIVGMLLLANFLIATFDQTPNVCLTSLFRLVEHYSTVCFGLLVAISTTLLICLVTIFVRLHRSTKVEVTARVAASRMVYYLALAVISNSFMIPFFFVESFMDNRGQSNRRGQAPSSPTLAMVAAVVATVSGVMTGGLYLFLKSSTLSTIGPRDKVTEYKNRRATYHDARRESGDFDEDDGSDTLVANAMTDTPSLRRVDSEASLTLNEKEEEALGGRSLKPASIRNGRRSPDSMRSNKFVSAVVSLMPKAPEPARIPSAFGGGHARKRSYSLFPRNTVATKASMLLLPSTTYSPSNALKPPPSMSNLANMRHRRDSSLVSTATVQIGLRLSSVNDLLPTAQKKDAASDDVVHTLDCPNVRKDLDELSPKRAGAVGASPAVLASPPDTTSESQQRDPVKAAKMKTLPAVPRINSNVPRAEPELQDVTLSPSVYSPQSSPSKIRLPSPKGVGFATPVPKPGSSSPPRSPPRRRGTEETTPLRTAVKSEWI